MEETIRLYLLLTSPTYLRCELISNLDDYGKKGSITQRLTGSRIYWWYMRLLGIISSAVSS